MPCRLSLLALASLTASIVAFAPAPVYREGLRKDLFDQVQGDWGTIHGFLDPLTGLFTPDDKLTTDLRIRGNAWQFVSPQYEGVKYDVLLDTRKDPAAIDFCFAGDPRSRVMRKGIVKVEGDMLTFCWMIRNQAAMSRPASFDPHAPLPGSDRLKVTTLKRIK